MKLLIEDDNGKLWPVSVDDELKKLTTGGMWGDVQANAAWLLGVITGMILEIEKGNVPFGGKSKPVLVSTVSGPITDLEPFEFDNVRAMIHPASKCKGSKCAIHNPSNHHMKLWPMILRESALVERQCPDGIGHPDPDSLAWMVKAFGEEAEGYGIHGCDGCCQKKEAIQ